MTAALIIVALYAAAVTGALVVLGKTNLDVSFELEEERRAALYLQREIERLRLLATKPGETPEFELLAQERTIATALRRVDARIIGGPVQVRRVRSW